MKRTILVILSLLLVIGGCSNNRWEEHVSSNDTDDNRIIFTVIDERSNTTDLTGRYVEVNYPDSYFEIRQNGTAILCEDLEIFGDYHNDYVKWLKIEEREGKIWLTFQYYTGSVWHSFVQFFLQEKDIFILYDAGCDFDETFTYQKS